MNKMKMIITKMRKKNLHRNQINNINKNNKILLNHSHLKAVMIQKIVKKPNNTIQIIDMTHILMIKFH